MLILPIKKKWFDMIVSGEKKEEYREIKPYYDSRFMNAFGFLLAGGQMVYGEAAPEEIRKPWPVPVVFRNGYSKDSPEIVCKCTLQFGEGKPEWGAETTYRITVSEKDTEVLGELIAILDGCPVELSNDDYVEIIRAIGTGSKNVEAEAIELSFTEGSEE